MGGVIVLFVLLQQYGQWILLGIVEEKTTRVIEVLLSTVRPRRLLSGKIIGMGVVAVLQAAAIAVAALVAASVAGNTSVLSALSVTILPTAAWCVLGYLFYCSLFATAGAMAARTEDAQNSAFPLMLVMFIGYGAAFSGLISGDPTPLLRVLAYVPPTAPFCMPVLVLVHGATWWQAGLSAAMTVASAVLLLRLAGRVYVASINRTRSRTRLRDLRAAIAA
jgi:ABC-2 type transport system permease protein